MAIEMFDIRGFLVTTGEMESFEEDAEYAADQLNGMLFSASDEMSQSEFWNADNAEEFISELVSAWLQEPSLIESDSDELDDYVRQVIRRIEQEQDGDE
ncbi:MULTISPECIES: hypothetical protein [Gammaproteobacteria]|uniref:hypothetical protein n=1 Tax=Gammaproteobacteria TaxID=1236 RepID=UPI000F811642|nr:MULTISPECIES: hypothetical protein [Gammaproteobacteria]RTE87209.1 hypothetical protein DQX04_02135 [Aliidiomarina sp. B3213]TCZ93003.1 hypothetical protein EYQ95_03170 [Lysobacter sp. N42]